MQRALFTPRARLLLPVGAAALSGLVLWLTLEGALPPDTQMMIVLAWIGVTLQILRWRRQYAQARGYNAW